MIDPALLPLIEAASIDPRLRSTELRVLMLACRELTSSEMRPFKLDNVLLPLRTARGRKMDRSNASRAVRALQAVGYLIRGPRQGLGGA